MKKLYITCPKDRGDGVYSLVADDGEHLASHYCSSAGFAESDLESGRPERQESWRKRFGEYKVLFVGDDEMTSEELLKRNKTWYEANEDKDKEVPRPSIEIEIDTTSESK